MNNAVYGKTMENVKKRVNVKLLTHWENIGKKMGAGILIAKPQFHSCSVISENLVAIQMNKTQITYDKPIYLGFCVLDLSKSHMYNFHYDYMKKKYGINAKLLYMDTDSLTYRIFKIGRAHVWTPVTLNDLVCRLLLEKKKKKKNNKKKKKNKNKIIM